VTSGGPALVQSALGYTGNLVSSQAVTFNAPVTSGDLIVVAVAAWSSNNSSVASSVTDNVGNSYSQAVFDPVPATSGEAPLSIWYAANAKPGTNVIVTVQVAAAGSLTVAIHEYSGMATTNVVDQVAHASATGPSASSGLTADQRERSPLWRVRSNRRQHGWRISRQRLYPAAKSDV
jgi:hypothetical protein